MSRSDALSTINLKPTDHIPHWEMISNPDFERRISGMDPYAHPRSSKLRMIEVLDLAIDCAPLSDDPVPEPSSGNEDGRSDGDRVRWGTGSTWSWNHHHVAALEDMLTFDPMDALWRPDSHYTFEDIQSYQPFFGKDQAELARGIRDMWNVEQANVGERCLALAGFYRTLVMWVLMLFDWDLFLEGVASHPDEMGNLLDRFGEMNLRIMRALASIDAPLVACHDDICMTSGPVCDPRFYRKHVYPWYERFWSILKEGGKKVIFFSDGNIDTIADDIFACGADGIYAEPYSDLARLAGAYGREKILWGNLDNRILMTGDRAAIRKEVDRCVAIGRDCPGYFLGVTNHIPWNVPTDAISYYFEYSRRASRR